MRLYTLEREMRSKLRRAANRPRTY